MYLASFIDFGKVCLKDNFIVLAFFSWFSAVQNVKQ